MPKVTIAQLWAQLPETITFEGYEFILSKQREKAFIGYYVNRCLSNNRRKREAFKVGVWWDNRPKISTCESQWLVKEPLMTDDDIELFFALDALIMRLEDLGLIPKQTQYIEPETITFETVTPLLLNFTNP